MSEIVAHTGETVDYSMLAGADERRAYFHENGYVVRPGLLPVDLCERALSSFHREVKPSPDYLYRQASANPEKHNLDDRGNVLNSILNPVSVSSRHFPDYRSASETLLCDDRLFAAIEELLREEAMIVQSMYFEGNPATWPHQDCYYLDSERPGNLIGAWIALEDIEQSAGRFYVVPGSHRLEAGRNQGSLNIGKHHERYKRFVGDIIREQSLEVRAPELKRGDVLLWDSRTIHGALSPRDRGKTRNSYTAHFIPLSSRLVQYQSIPISLRPERIRDHALCRPKDQDRQLSRWIMATEIRAPRVFQYMKRKIISWKIVRHGPWQSRPS